MFQGWLQEMALHVKGLAPRQLLTIGQEVSLPFTIGQ